MNIKALTDNIMPERLVRLETNRTGSAPKTGRPGVRSDRADTSRLSQMMSNSSRELGAMTKPRQDRINAFEDSLDEPIYPSIRVTNVIFDHMING